MAVDAVKFARLDPADVGEDEHQIETVRLIDGVSLLANLERRFQVGDAFVVRASFARPRFADAVELRQGVGRTETLTCASCEENSGNHGTIIVVRRNKRQYRYF